MKRVVLALAAVIALLVPATALAKDIHDPVRVSWNGAPPSETPAGGTWDVAFTLVQGPGGFYPETAVHPVLVVTGPSGAIRRFAARVDGAENAFRARIRFPEVGRYTIALVSFDPLRPSKTADLTARIAAPAGASGGGGSSVSWGWIAGAAGLAALAALVVRTLRRSAAPA